jgi:integrase
MPSIETRKTKSGKVSFRVKVQIKGYPTKSATFSTRADAKKYAEQAQYEIRTGIYFKKAIETHTVDEMINRYIREVLPQKKDYKKQYAQLLWWQSTLGHYKLNDVTAPIIAKERDALALEKKLMGSTVNRYLAALSHVFTLAHREWEWISDSPMRKVNRKKEPRGRVRFLSDDERHRLLTACKNSKNPHLYTIVVIAISSGGRYSEIRNLTWESIDLIQGKAVIEQTKNGDRKTLFLKGHALDLLIKINGFKSNGLVFPSTKNRSKPINIRSAWVKAVKEAGLTDWHFHDNRHEAASLLLKNKASLPEIAEILSHKSLNMVRRYAHLAESHTANVVAEMNERVFGHLFSE